MLRKAPLRLTILVAIIAGISLAHYHTPIHHVWLHPLLQSAYYVPLVLIAVWYGWRIGLLAAILATTLYIPHIEVSWRAHPEYTAASYIELGMFFVITLLTGVLAEHERTQRHKAEETARKLAEVNAQLQDSFEHLRRADRLSALGELSAGLAHEVRNPLGSVEGAVQILGRPNLPDATRVEFRELAQKELNRLKGLLTHFLNFARPQEPRRALIEPGLILQSVAQLSAETAKMAGVHLQTEVSTALPPISLDAEQIKQVLLNLVLNATQAMPKGGDIVLRAIARHDAVVFEVADQGVGIPPENLERIFDPFYTTRDSGTGLGLSIAYRIISQHGGHIAVRNNSDGGTTFSVQLPLTQRSAVPHPAQVGG